MVFSTIRLFPNDNRQVKCLVPTAFNVTLQGTSAQDHSRVNELRIAVKSNSDFRVGHGSAPLSTDDRAVDAMGCQSMTRDVIL